MSLQLKGKLKSCDCKNLLFTETTGQYQSSNTTGWGTPNPLVNAATTATLTITTPSGSNYVFSIYNAFPSSNINSSYSIPYSSLGFSDNLVDGYYTVVYSVTVTETVGIDITAPVIHTTTIRTFINCNLECCIDQMLNDNDCNCDCNDDSIDNFIEAYSILKQIEHAIECGDLTKANKLSIIGNKLCKNINCSTCK